ncbi:MAG: hypothetical protein P8I55_16040 [Crocinitomix sp.]|nr:hypothetical protein [Crocinitomix sp.]
MTLYFNPFLYGKIGSVLGSGFDFKVNPLGRILYWFYAILSVAIKRR